jgi:hypothetical protein
VFGFAQWDSPVALVLEALLSVAIVVALIFVARRVNAQAAADRERYLRSRNALSASENRATTSGTASEPGESNIESN